MGRRIEVLNLIVFREETVSGKLVLRIRKLEERSLRRTGGVFQEAAQGEG